VGLNIVKRAITRPPTIPIPINIGKGKFHVTAADEKHKRSNMPVLLTVPSKVIFFSIGRSENCASPSNLFPKTGLPDRPKVFSAACFDIKAPKNKIKR